MSREDFIYGLHAGPDGITGPIFVGLSSIIGVTAVAGQVAVTIKYFSGGSLEIGGQSLTWGGGYLMGTSEQLNLTDAGTFFLAAKSATVTCFVLRGRGVGYAPGQTYSQGA